MDKPFSKNMTTPLLCAIMKIEKHDGREKMDQIINHTVFIAGFLAGHRDL